MAKFRDLLKLPLNTERLQKLTGSYVVNNNKISEAIGKPLPVSSKEGLLKRLILFIHMLNRIIALIVLILLSPVILLVALAIFFEDGFPIFFTQKRVGINYTFFNIFKFRSMKKNTPNIAKHLLTNPEQYLLKFGAFIRKTSMDELPNLINILKGEMVFVGPRPALYNQDNLMALREAAGVDKLKPGITGWAQINGRDEISIEAKVALEKEYLDKKSFWFDMEILVKTFTNVLFSKGVTH